MTLTTTTERSTVSACAWRDSASHRGESRSEGVPSARGGRPGGAGGDLPSATIVLPTYCERETVGPVVDDLLSLSCVERVIVVDDDSPDDTAEFVRRAFGGETLRGTVSTIVRPDGGDLSTAVLRGFAEAETDICVCMDADGQHPPAAVPELVAAVGDGADLAVGSRHVGDGLVDADWSRVRDVMSFGASLLAWAAVPESRATQDPMSGCFAVHRPVVEAVRKRLDPAGHKILLELLAQCPVDRVAEVPIRFASREAGESKTDAGECLRYLRHMGDLAVRARQEPRPRRERRRREVGR